MNVVIRKRNGMILGPISIEDLSSLLSTGQVLKNEWAAQVGSNDWQEVQSFLKSAGAGSNPMASHLKRFVAFVVDCALLVAISFVLTPVMEKIPTVLNNHWDKTRHFLLSCMLWQISISLLQASRMQASIGKAMLGLAVVSEDNRRLSLSQSIARQFAFAATASFLVFFLMPLFTRRRQAAHDVMLHTVVIEV
ncbi:RDD family protein [bacterium]|nr:RDD family protein [bacterium]